MRVVIDRRFFASAHALGSHADRVFSFLDRLLADPSRDGAHLERIEHAADAKLCSVRVSAELRAIGLEDGPQLVLLYVGHHDDAYRWARTHRTVSEANGLSIVEIPEVGLEGSGIEGRLEPPCDPAGTCSLNEGTAVQDRDSD